MSNEQNESKAGQPPQATIEIIVDENPFAVRPGRWSVADLKAACPGTGRDHATRAERSRRRWVCRGTPAPKIHVARARRRIFVIDDFPPIEQLLPLQELCQGEVRYERDAWRKFAIMNSLSISTPVGVEIVDAMVCLNHDNQSYPTKLYLSRNLGAGLNWNECPVFFGKTWHTYSWAGISPQQTVIEILAGHLSPLNRGRP
jgi:hypothetical protein